MANKKVRKVSQDYFVGNKSKNYKKIFETWEIQDYVSYCSSYNT